MNAHSIIESLHSLDPLSVYLLIGGIAFIENIFPPFPSDVVVVAAGTLIGIGTISFPLAVGITTIGSTLGFTATFLIGQFFGKRFLETGKIPFTTPAQIEKVHSWFARYGYTLIIVNRFLAGTRAIISFCAGVAEMKLAPSIILSALSALIWNGLLLYGGMKLGEHWRRVVWIVETYSIIVTIIISAIIVFFIFRAILRKRNAR